jgi:lipooligosaccharide transport system permease protein
MSVLTAGGLRVVQRNAWVYRRVWRGSIFSSFLTPVLFLGAMGLGLGSLVDRGQALGGLPYVAFLAPGLLAAGAMQTASFESTFPITAKVHWRRNYEAMLATPLKVLDLLVGEVIWISIRLALVTSVFLGVMLAFGLVRSPLGVLAVPAAVLTGLSFSGLIMALAAQQKDGSAFNALFRFGITPLFLFSGTFFPVEQLPELIRPLAYVTPLYHGVSLARDLTLGSAELLPSLLHVGVLLVFIVVGVTIAYVSLRRRLVT